MIRQGLDKRPWCDARDGYVLMTAEELERELEQMIDDLRAELADVRAARGDTDRTSR